MAGCAGCENCSCDSNPKVPIRIGIMIGSDSDLVQCLDGLQWLSELAPKHVRVEAVLTASIHRNTQVALENLEDYDVDVWVIGAGMANHLTGTSDAYLRYTLKKKTPVIGVVFEGKTEKDNIAGILSVEKVPGTQVIFDHEKHFGALGFWYACRLAAAGNFPEIKISEAKSPKTRTLQQAIEVAKQLIKEKEGK